VPLAQFNGPPEPIVRKCRARIDRDAPANEHENPLAATQFLAGLRYNNRKSFQILGGRKAMIKSPLVQELIQVLTAERTRATLIEILVPRFGAKAQALETELKAIDDEARLQELVKHAATCRTLGSFRKQLSS